MGMPIRSCLAGRPFTNGILHPWRRSSLESHSGRQPLHSPWLIFDLIMPIDPHQAKPVLWVIDVPALGGAHWGLVKKAIASGDANVAFSLLGVLEKTEKNQAEVTQRTSHIQTLDILDPCVGNIIAGGDKQIEIDSSPSALAEPSGWRWRERYRFYRSDVNLVVSVFSTVLSMRFLKPWWMPCPCISTRYSLVS